VTQTVSWPLPRADGRTWTAVVTPSADSEEREALQNLLGLFALLAACSAAMLVVMRVNVRRAFRPLESLLAAIAGIEREDLAAVKALPSMPIRELEAMSQALRRLASSLEQAEEARRLLARQVLTLQEDERQRLARDLHDEFGQRLTALRADASWLRRRVSGDESAVAVAQGMDEHIARIQRDVRDLLVRLQPLGGEGRGEMDRNPQTHGAPASGRASPDPASRHSGIDGTESATRLAALLDDLAASWSRPDGSGLRCEASVGVADSLHARDGRPGMDEGPRLPRSLVLAIYRMSQEACTNAARHAGARCVTLDVAIEPDATGALSVDWTAADDGTGLVDTEGALHRGNGLAGMRERAWAHGGSFDWSPSNPPPMPGLRLHARFTCAPGE
jgi:two-component system sensor histidine kinase UhpB